MVSCFSSRGKGHPKASCQLQERKHVHVYVYACGGVEVEAVVTKIEINICMGLWVLLQETYPIFILSFKRHIL